MSTSQCLLKNNGSIIINNRRIFLITEDCYYLQTTGLIMSAADIIASAINDNCS